MVAKPEKMEVTNKKLFFLYAHPCAEVIVARGAMKQEELDSIRHSLLLGKTPDAPPIAFRVAYRLLEFIAKKKNKDCIDEEVMHDYFWHSHDEFVLEECKHRPDVCADKCIVYPAEIKKVDGNEAEALTPIGVRKVNISFTPKVKQGDFVTIHYDYACEKIPEKTFKELWSEKS